MVRIARYAGVSVNLKLVRVFGTVSYNPQNELRDVQNTACALSGFWSAYADFCVSI